MIWYGMLSRASALFIAELFCSFLDRKTPRARVMSISTALPLNSRLISKVPEWSRYLLNDGVLIPSASFTTYPAHLALTSIGNG